MRLTIEVGGIELRGFHGVLDEERSEGQRFRFDVSLEVPRPAEDSIDAAVDYRDVVACVREISDGTHFQLLETLAAAVADELARRFPAERVRVSVGKPDVELEGGHATVTAER
ncbi:MAG TPA: dihydroneopterin aldolase [Gaiellaceae bacterium]|nr:dihydroneopterin aldolase [Gaiellaceae bacterium]